MAYLYSKFDVITYGIDILNFRTRKKAKKKSTTLAINYYFCKIFFNNERG